MKGRSDKIVDCLIVGAGPAGLSAALEAARRGMESLVLEASEPGGQALAAGRIDNFPGFPEGISGRELMDRWLEHTEARGVRMVRKRVTRLARRGGVFVAETDGDRYKGRSAIVATGLKPKCLGVRGERELMGRRVFSYVDPSTLMHEDKRVLLVGGGDVAFDMAIGFATAARSVTIVMRGAAPRCTPSLLERARRAGVKVVTGLDVRGFSEDSYGVKVDVSHESKSGSMDADLIVACIGKESGGDIMSTRLADGTPGLFLAGDYRSGRQTHISIAAGDGTAAAAAAGDYLKQISKFEIRNSKQIRNSKS